MSRRRPAKEAIRTRGWLRAHKWLLLRRASQAVFIALFLTGPLFGVWITRGTLASSETFEVLPLTDPFILLQGLAAGHLPELTAITGAIIVILGYLAVGGRTYCSWVCPVNPLTDLAHWLNRALALPKGPTIKRNTRLFAMAMVLVFSALTGTVFFEIVNPVTGLHRALVFGLSGAWLLIAAIFAFDLLIMRHGWCGHLCPVGAFYGQINRFSLVKVSASNRADCDDCMDCYAVCPEPHVITPALKPKYGSASPLITMPDCTSCARCIDVCSKNVFQFQTRFKSAEKPGSNGRLSAHAGGSDP